jgi:GT2 family glycosyltransferase
MGDINFSVDTGLVEALKGELGLTLFVETGTFEGDAIQIARPYFDEIHSIELSPEYHAHATKRFGKDPAVHLYLGDSAKQLRALRPVFDGKPTLFWLDAHWCVAANTGGEKSQCPLLEEIKGVGRLNDRSAIMIDDARLFTSPPPHPHEISQWPRFDEVVDALRSVGGKDHELKIFNDVIVFAPRQANQALTDYMARNTVTLLKIKDKAFGYDVLDAQLKEKHAENTALKAFSLEKDTEIAELKAETDTKDVEIKALKAEADAKDTEIADLKREADRIKAELEAECAQKDTEIAELKAEADGKDAEIASLKQVSNEREQLIFTLDGHVKEFQRIVGVLNASLAAKDQEIAALTGRQAELGSQLKALTTAHAALEKQEAALRAKHDSQEARLRALPEDVLKWGEACLLKDNHIQNLDAIIATRATELANARRELAARDDALAGMAGAQAHHEIAKFHLRQLAAKEAVIQQLSKACVEREALIQRLSLEAAGLGGRVAKLWTGARAHVRMKISQPIRDWCFHRIVERHEMQVGILRQHEPRDIRWDKLPKYGVPEARLPRVGIVTPSYNQEAFVESTLLSVLNQDYPKLEYVVQDGASKDRSPEVIARHADRLKHWESTPDQGQGHAIQLGFRHLEHLGPDDVMAYLNSDDFIAPRALRYVAEYFATHPDVDVVYGNRIIIDDHDREIGRWVMPPHDPRTLEWIDYVPQETLFWRKKVWDRAGGIDRSFQFALDWDLLLRFAAVGARTVRLPYALGCFRVHPKQKTSEHIHSVGNDEMTLLRLRLHPEGIDPARIEHYARKARFWGAVCSRLAGWGIRL